MSIVCVGAVGLDYIAHVSAFPAPDAKIRTTAAFTAAGGNACNSSSSIARLGWVKSALVSLVGTDGTPTPPPVAHIIEYVYSRSVMKQTRGRKY
jgi:sugar/nucleoside kinase (ribokinase family)